MEAGAHPEWTDHAVTYGCIASMRTRPGLRDEVVALLPSAAGGFGL
ncbi:hypothetical protein EV562_111173 [Streptomyces sp. BK208]|nr:hypothetical protein [Streptomyces sp. BK208]TDT31566.1 hypothetical protein EV562_111173 [Streptomyces sp. BK208]